MLFQNRYDYNPRLDFLADDGQSKAYKARDVQQNRDVVIKFYYTLPNSSDEFRTRMEQVKQLRHPNLIQLYQYIELDNINALGEPEHLRIGIWEYASTSAFQADESSTEATENAVRGVLKGLQYLHTNGLTHGQLTLQNAFIDHDGNVKLSNYALSPTYLDSDFRATGKMLHELLSGSSPGINEAGEMYLRLPSNVREAYTALIDQCLDKNDKFPSSSAGELLHFLDHYDRNKLFDKVLPLSEEQFLSRYRFDLQNDKIDQSSSSLTYKAHDNLLDVKVFLEIFNMDTPINAGTTDALDKSQYANLFKVDMSNGEAQNRMALIGVLSANNALFIDPNSSKDTLTIATPDNSEQAAAATDDNDNALATISEPVQDEADNASTSADNAATSDSVVMSDMDLAKELAAFDSMAIEKMESLADESSETLEEQTDPEAQEPWQANDADEERQRHDKEDSPETETDNVATVADDDDFVSLDTAEEEPQNVNTEFIQHEAMAQVQRDIERLLSLKDRDS